MNIRFGRRRRIRFSDKTHPFFGILSLIIGSIALVLIVILFSVSSSAKGNAGMTVGALGLLDLIASIFGLVFAVRCYHKEDIYMTTPRIGLMLNGLVVLIFVILYVIGALA